MKKIVSFCLYGKKEIYLQGAVENSKLVSIIYPGWTGRFYVDRKVPRRIKSEIVENGCEVLEFETKKGMNPMLTRFLPWEDISVDLWISRDCDSRLNWREKAAVDEWIESDKTFHLMRDCHNHYYPIMGGMFGIKNFKFKEKFGNLPKVHLYYSGENDQSYLEKFYWSSFSQDLLCHDTWNHNSPLERNLTVRRGEKVSWKKAYRVGLVDYLKTEKNIIFKRLFDPQGQINKDFPDHREMEIGIYVGQRIGKNNKVILNRDTRWEYEIRGISYE
jgi:hypothetical protein